MLCHHPFNHPESCDLRLLSQRNCRVSPPLSQMSEHIRVSWSSKQGQSDKQNDRKWKREKKRMDKSENEIKMNVKSAVTGLLLCCWWLMGHVFIAVGPHNASDHQPKHVGLTEAQRWGGREWIRMDGMFWRADWARKIQNNTFPIVQKWNKCCTSK